MDEIFKKMDFSKIIDFFKSKVNDRLWEEVKSESINSQDDTRLNALKELVKLRENVDFFIYYLATEKVFPKDFYNIKISMQYEVEKASFGNILNFLSEKFAFSVYKKKDEKDCPLSFNILVVSSGSKTVTSTSDTTIYVNENRQPADKQSSVDDRNDFLAHSNTNIKNDCYDIEGIIGAAIVEKFHEINGNFFGVTSSVHRDSNIYLDISSKWENLVDIYTDKILRIKALSKYQNIINNIMKIKNNFHALNNKQELVASFFVLKEILNKSEWIAYKQQIFSRIEIIVKNLSSTIITNFSSLDLELIKKYLQGMFVEIEKNYGEYSNLIENTYLRKTNTVYALNSPLYNNKKIFKCDMLVSAANDLYSFYLYRLSSYRNKISKFLESLDIEIQKLSEILSHKKPYFLGCFAPNITKFLTKVMAMLQHLADMQIYEQKLLYKSLTYSNKAYTNKSAKIHVVKGMQDKIDVQINCLVTVGSILQQIGFKYVHARELEEKNKSLAEKIYLTAKYGYRIYNLYLSQITESKQSFLDIVRLDRNISISSINKIFEKNALDNFIVLPALFNTNFKHKIGVFCSKNEIILLNSEADIINNVKKTSLSEKTKLQETMNIIKKRMNLLYPNIYSNTNTISENDIQHYVNNVEKDLFLNISINIICLGCLIMISHAQTYDVESSAETIENNTISTPASRL